MFDSRAVADAPKPPARRRPPRRRSQVGADHSRWHDVYLALRGRYGARTTPDVEGDPRTSVMYVAAPIHDTSPAAAARSSAWSASASRCRASASSSRRRARKTLELGATSVVAVLLLVVILSVWLVRPFGVISDYVRYVRAERSFSLPRLGRRALGAFGAAYDEMRDALAGRNYVADYVQTMTHEVKGPLSAIRGAAELLQEPMADADRARFVANIARETQRIQELVDRMMELTALEIAAEPRARRAGRAARARRRGRGERARRRRWRAASLVELLRRRGRPGGRGRRLPAAARARQPGRQRDRLLAARRPQSRSRSWRTRAAATSSSATSGPGIPDFAEDKVFEKFYSLARPATAKKSTGLGLSFVKEIADAAPRPRDAEERSPAAARWRRSRCRSAALIRR